jgi:hypothetical protein
MKLDESRTAVDKYGHYVDPHTHEMWAAFKHGLAYSPHRGTFVIAEIVDGKPYFNPTPRTYAFKDLAKSAMTATCERMDTPCAVYQQIAMCNPVPKDAGK